MAVSTKLTIEDFERLPQEMVDYKELVNGELIDVSGNNVDHNYLRDWLLRRLADYLDQAQLGKILSEQEYAFGDDAHGPDLSLIGIDKLALVVQLKRVQPFVPDLAIEIRSPNDSRTSLIRKAEKYRQFGVTEVWLFDQDARQALVFRESAITILNDSHVFEPETIPGFSVSLKSLFDLTF